MDDRASLRVAAPAPATSSSRPPLRSLVLTWLGTALAVSFVMWWVGSSFYDRFHVLGTDRPSWDPWSALELPTQLLAWMVTIPVGLWWRRRGVVTAVAAVVALALAGAAHAWVQHEADRARSGTPVASSVWLPFSFSARAVTLLPYEDALPPGIPARVLLLWEEPSTHGVYDPASGQTIWVGDRIATWGMSEGGTRWAK